MIPPNHNNDQHYMLTPKGVVGDQQLSNWAPGTANKEEFMPGAENLANCSCIGQVKTWILEENLQLSLYQPAQFPATFWIFIRMPTDMPSPSTRTFPLPQRPLQKTAANQDAELCILVPPHDTTRAPKAQGSLQMRGKKSVRARGTVRLCLPGSVTSMAA